MELRSELSKQYLAEALLRLMQTEDYNKISIGAIAQKAGLSHMAYYRNFADKDDILVYYLEKITADFVKESNLDFATQPPLQAFTTLFEHLYKQLELSQLLFKHNKLHLAQAQFDKYFLLKAKSEADGLYRLYVSGGVFRLYCEWIKNGANCSPRELASAVCTFL